MTSCNQRYKELPNIDKLTVADLIRTQVCALTEQDLAVGRQWTVMEQVEELFQHMRFCLNKGEVMSLLDALLRGEAHPMMRPKEILPPALHDSNAHRVGFGQQVRDFFLDCGKAMFGFIHLVDGEVLENIKDMVLVFLDALYAPPQVVIPYPEMVRFRSDPTYTPVEIQEWAPFVELEQSVFPDRPTRARAHHPLIPRHDDGSDSDSFTTATTTTANLSELVGPCYAFFAGGAASAGSAPAVPPRDACSPDDCQDGGNMSRGSVSAKGKDPASSQPSTPVRQHRASALTASIYLGPSPPSSVDPPTGVAHQPDQAGHMPGQHAVHMDMQEAPVHAHACSRGLGPAQSQPSVSTAGFPGPSFGQDLHASSASDKTAVGVADEALQRMQSAYALANPLETPKVKNPEAGSPQGTCNDCSMAPSSEQCHDCAASLCADCSSAIHGRKLLQHHRRTPLRKDHLPALSSPQLHCRTSHNPPADTTAGSPVQYSGQTQSAATVQYQWQTGADKPGHSTQEPVSLPHIQAHAHTCAPVSAPSGPTRVRRAPRSSPGHIAANRLSPASYPPPKRKAQSHVASNRLTKGAASPQHHPPLLPIRQQMDHQANSHVAKCHTPWQAVRLAGPPASFPMEHVYAQQQSAPDDVPMMSPMFYPAVLP
eukprot:gene7655-1369_t